MAKPRDIPGLTPELSYAEVAAKVVAIRAEELIEHSKGVLDITDIERVHDMRVATRRLRAALEAFEPCFPERPFKRTLRDLKDLADTLGERRDRDVSIGVLDGFVAEMPSPDRSGVKSLIRRLREEQQEANVALERWVDRESMAQVRRSIARLVRAAA